MRKDSFFARRSKRILSRSNNPARFELFHFEERAVPSVAGRVFQDYNGNGSYDTTTTIPNAGQTITGNASDVVATAVDSGVAGVTVTAYDSNNNVVTSTSTAADGTYSLATTPGNYRVEFTGIPAGFQVGSHGVNNRTAVQFVSDGSTNTSLGLTTNASYFTNNPLLMTSLYYVGDQNTTPLPGGTFIPSSVINSAQPTILSFPYNSGTTSQTDITAGATPTTHQIAVQVGSVGSTFGLGYDRVNNRVFSAAYTKRNVAWGPGGPGTIYTFNIPTDGSTVSSATPWFTLPTASVVGTATGAADPTAFGDFRVGYTNQDNYAQDGGNKGWNAVGKTSFGGLDVNETGTQVYVMNLFDKSLYVIPINADGSAGTPQSFVVPRPSNATGSGLQDVQPFAVQYYKGLVYIGVVNSAESTGNASDLRAYVYTFNPATNTYSTSSVLNESGTVEGVSLDYNKGTSYGGADRFLPWTSTVNTVNPVVNDANLGNQPGKYPQPMLSSIAFDAQGNMNLGIRDRAGDQFGRGLPADPRNPSAFIEGIASGDLLRTYITTPGNWALEANGSVLGANPATGTGVNNNQGPLADPTQPAGAGNPGGTFYGAKGYGGANPNGTDDGGHRDVMVGGVAQVPGFPDVASTTYDPLRQGPLRSGGIRMFNDTTGTLDKSYTVYGTDQGLNTFGKANGIGDLLAIEPQPQPVEISNRVFLDTNNNGIQDVGENGIDGVQVQLWSADGTTPIATATTSNGGQYYFNSGPAPGSTGLNEVYGLSKLVAGGSYQVRIPFGSGGVNSGLLGTLIPTKAFADPSNPQRDSNLLPGNLVAGSNATAQTGVISVTLANTPGVTNSTFDAGFVNGLALGDFVFVDQSNTGTYDPANGDVGLSAVPVQLFAADVNGNPTGAALASTTTGANGFYNFTGLLPGSYVVEITSPVGYRSSSGNGLDPLNGPFESGLTTNTNTNNTDHGFTLSGNDAQGYVIRTKAVTLFDPNDPNNTNPDTFPGASGANLRQDFGLFPVYSLGNRVFIDSNNNGTLDAGEAGKDGVSVKLFLSTDFGANGQLNGGATPARTTITANGGYYRFDDLLGAIATTPNQGKYVVVVDGTSNSLTGFVSSTGGTSATTTFEPNPATIPPLPAPGVRVDSLDNGTTIAGSQVRSPVVTLGPNGNAPIGETDLVPGTPTALAQGTIDAQADMTIDFGFYQPLALGNQIWNDKNNSGKIDAADGATPGIDGVRVSLFRADVNGAPTGVALESQTTKSGGYYLFTGLGTDSYVVTVDGTTLPGYAAGTIYWLSSSGSNGSLTGPNEQVGATGTWSNPNTDRTDGTDRGNTNVQNNATFLIQSRAVSLSPGTGPAGQLVTPPAAGFPTVALADSNLTMDFGFYQPESLGNFVWADVNNNGVFDVATETGIDSVAVRLYSDTDNSGTFNSTVDQLIGSTTTSNGGYYLFQNLAAGGYFVEITPPAGYSSSTGGVGNPYEPGTTDISLAADTKDHGTNSNTVVRSGLVTLSPGTLSTGFPATPGQTDLASDGNKTYAVDFGLFQSLSLGDFVFNDRNNNGVFDGTDTPISGVNVVLLDGNQNPIPNSTTTTDSKGNYLFQGLAPGKYFVAITPPSGYISSTGTNGNLTSGKYEPGLNDFTNNADHGTTSGIFIIGGPVVLGNAGDTAANPDNTGFANLRQDFGLFQPLSLGDFVWNDANNNGVLDTGEVGIPNVAVTLLDSGGNTVGNTTTDGNGFYLFKGLVPDTYTVRVTTPAGYTTSTGKNGSLTGPFEPGVSGTQNNQDHGTQNSTLTQFTESTVTLGDVGTAGNPDQVTIAGDANLRQDFGFFQPLSLGDFVWNDTNNNGVLDAGENALGSVPVTLLDSSNNVVATTTTDSKGLYLFTNLIPGSYRVSITPPTGFISSTGTVGSPTGPYEPGVSGTQNNEDHGTQTGSSVVANVTLSTPGTNPDSSGMANLRQDFGLFQPLSLGDFVWNDVNNNGVFDATEAGIAGVSVSLLDSTSKSIATTTTDATGQYLFTNLSPGTYSVQITPPAGYVTSTGKNGSPTGPYEPGANGTQNSEDHGSTTGATITAGPVTLGNYGDTTANPDTAGTANLRQDFGLFQPLSLGDFVWNDSNNNGVFDATEQPLVSVNVALLDSTGTTIATTTTDSTGKYLFTGLIAGNYTVQVTTPTGFISSTGKNGSPNGPYEPGVNGTQNNEDHGTANGAFTDSSVTLAAPGSASNPDNGGLANLRQDFGFFQPEQLGDFVWNDINNNGVLDSGEPGLAGVSIALLDSTGATIATTTTDNNGNYLFTNLTPGSYTVQITPPTGYVTSSGTNGSLTGPFEPGVNGTQNNQDHGTASGNLIVSQVTLGTPGAASNPDSAGLANLRQDFGLYLPLQLGNTVFTDTNNNGILDSGETGIPNLTVRLFGPDGTTLIATTTTDSTGMYLFPNLTPGQYVIEVVPPANGVASTPVFPFGQNDQQNIGTQTGTNIRSGVLTLALGQAPLIGGNTNANYFVNADFGIRQPIAQVSGYTYFDANRSATYDQANGDKPIPVVTVTLTGTDNTGATITRTTTTDGTGFYQFTNLNPGNYTITETQPVGAFYHYADNVGSLGGSNPNSHVLTVTLAANDNGQQYNFGEVAPADVFGYVWVDTNKNCVRDASEPVVGNVPVTISGTAFAGTSKARPLTAADVPGGLTILTDGSGRYEFPLLPPGTYSVTRGTLPAAVAAQYQDWCLQQGDPSGTPPTVGKNVFTNVITTPSIRGPLNFGLAPITVVAADSEATKRDFLGSTTTPTVVVPPTTIPPPGGPTTAAVSMTPSFSVSTGNPTVPTYVTVSGGTGLAPQVRVLDYATGLERFRLTPYESSFTGGVRTAVGDINGDGTMDIVTVTGPGGGPRVRVFDGKTGGIIYDFFVFESTYRGGAYVSVGDTNGDGKADIIVGADAGGGPRVVVVSGATGQPIGNFFAFDSSLRTGVRVASADMNGDGVADIIASAGPGVQTLVNVFDGKTATSGSPTLLKTITPFEAAFTGGVNIATGDFNGDGRADLIIGADAGGGPRVNILDGNTGSMLTSFFAFDQSFTGGVRVAAKDVNGDGKADVVVTEGKGGAARVRILRATDLSSVEDFTAFDPSFTGGAFVG